MIVIIMPLATHGHVYIIHFFDLILHKLVLVGFRALLIVGFYEKAEQDRGGCKSAADTRKIRKISLISNVCFLILFQDDTL